MKYISLFIAMLVQTVLVAQKLNVENTKYSKNSWHVGLTFGVEDMKDENIEILLLDIENNHNSGFNINVTAGYFFQKDMSTGFTLSYSRDERDLSYYSTNITLSHYQSASAKQIASIFLRNYFPLSKDKGISFFNGTVLSVGFENILIRRTQSLDDIHKEFSDNFILNFGLTPGISFFLVKGFSFETSINLIGLKYKRKKIITDEVSIGNSSDVNFDFDINLLTLNFSLAYYF